MGLLPCRLPDSEISGSKPVSGSPELIAAAHVLRHLSTPRHPPYALCSLTVYLRHARSCSRPRFLQGTPIPAPCSSWSFYRLGFLFYSVFKEQWSWTGSNRRPPACKADALPTELQPQAVHIAYPLATPAVGLGRIELPTSRLSGVRSNQLSYRPRTSCRQIRFP